MIQNAILFCLIAFMGVFAICSAFMEKGNYISGDMEV